MEGLDLAEPGAGRDVVFAEACNGGHVMARTRDRKLLVEGEREFLFNLEEDPCELEDVSADHSHAGHLEELRAAVGMGRAAARLPETYYDERAPVIDQPNVPTRGDGHRERMSAWYRERVGATGLLRPE